MSAIPNEGGEAELGVPFIISVDDDENDGFLLRSALKAKGLSWKLEQAVHGEDAIDQLTRQRGGRLPDLVLLDLKMPRLNGTDVLQWIRAEPDFQNLSVAMFTSSEHSKDIKSAYQSGADAYLVKPSAFDELGQLVRVLTQALENRGSCDLTVLSRSECFRPDPRPANLPPPA
jgi:CheY-like chemotaxis protein